MKLSCTYRQREIPESCNVGFVRGVYGLGRKPRVRIIAKDVELPYRRGSIVLFGGPSGSGKSSLLREAARRTNNPCVLEPRLDAGKPLIDLLGDDPIDAARVLGLCGLGEANLMLHRPSELSEGQKFRFALARAIAAGAKTVVVDEWCAKLDRPAARVLSRNVRRIADRQRIGFLLATSHDDLLDDLAPDVTVRCALNDAPEVRCEPQRRKDGLLGELEIVRGAASDWAKFADWHYRGKGLGPIRRVYLLKHRSQPVGICVFAYGSLFSAGRNAALGLGGKLTSKRARWINQNVATITRLVIDPRYRGAGIASWFLRHCCSRVPWRYIEIVGQMLNVVPFYRGAGFRAIAPAAKKRPGDHARCWGHSNWTPAGKAAYLQRTRNTRPLYVLRDNTKI